MRLMSWWLASLLFFASSAPAPAGPNFVIIYADDLGYGDLGCYGHPTIRTPHLDRMAAEGMRFTEFYSAAEVCTPSRAALLTGRYPIRNGMCHDQHRVLRRNSAGGLPQDERTLPELLKEQGYATGCVGKWHLGHLPQHLPPRHGFDSYFGMPFSNDMRPAPDAPKDRDQRFFGEKNEYWQTPLIRGTEIVDPRPDQHVITKLYTEDATRFIRDHKAGSFFLYMAHSFPHVPLFASKDFEGRSAAGRYGDVVEELDWSVGEVLDTLRKEGLADNTIVVFSSDNGPWLIFNQHGGSAGLLKEGKGSTYEGGMRVPGIAWCPGTIPAGSVQHEMACTMDLFTTFAKLGGASVPADRPIDGIDIYPLLTHQGSVERPPYFYYRGTQLFAVRQGPWKAHFLTQPGYGQPKPDAHDPPELYHLGIDPSERFNVAAQHAEVAKDLAKVAAEHRASFVPGPTQLIEVEPAK
ncbi:MAG: arylsulfatase [Planctomycetota bacterium]|nr:MAG: arylsulfatase [Planctomycetota bacterium]